MSTHVPLLPRSAGLLAALLAALLLMLLFGPLCTTAQTIDDQSAGRTFVIAFPDTTTNKVDMEQAPDRTPRQDTFIVALYSGKPNQVLITGNGGYSRTLSMAAGGFEMVYLNGNPRASTPVVTESGVVSNKTFRIEAEEPVVVYCFMATKFGTEAWTPIPVENWGMEHYAAALPGELLRDVTSTGQSPYYKTILRMASSEILVVAAYDNTQVTIVPNGRLNANPPTTVVLKKDQCYQVQSYVDTSDLVPNVPQPDLGGSYIYSSRPIGVITGNTRSQVLDQSGGLAKNSFKNMMIEWIAPTEQHGTQFVYLPTSDTLTPTGAAGENPDWKRQGELVRIYGTSGGIDDEEPTMTEGVDIEGRNGYTVRTFKIERTKFFETLVGAPTPHVFITDKPTQAMMNSSAVVKYVQGSTPWFESWGPYMVEMTPRDQWPHVAPYVVPNVFNSTEHYLNIVTTEASRGKITIDGTPLVIDRLIAGTDLYWGSRKLAAGARGVIAGTVPGATFYAFVYGGKRGIEASAPWQYREDIGMAYGYPLSPRRMVLRPSDSLLIDTLHLGCSTLRVRIRTLNDKPVGLRSITLDSGVNARLVFNDPAPPAPVIGLTKAEVEIRAIDPLKPASGVLVITDRSGRSWRIPYSYDGSGMKVTPADGLDFGELTLGTKSAKQVTIVNSGTAPVRIDTLLLALGGQGFTITSTKPAVSTDPLNRTVLAPGDTLTVTIEALLTTQNRTYRDTLRVNLGCPSMVVPIRAVTLEPCIMMSDLDFGVLAPGQEAARMLEICNRGLGRITFSDPWLTWLQSEFSVSQSDIDRLRTARLDLDSCVSIAVTFKASEIGVYRTVARFWAITRTCRDTSVWTAVVQPPAGVDDGSTGATGLAGYRMERIEPNPVSSTATIAFGIGAAGHTRVEIFDARGVLVSTVADKNLDAGEYRLQWSGESFPSGVYYCRIVSGAWSVTRPVLLMR